MREAKFSQRVRIKDSPFVHTNIRRLNDFIVSSPVCRYELFHIQSRVFRVRTTITLLIMFIHRIGRHRYKNRPKLEMWANAQPDGRPA